jgi:hypothetical protein
VADFEKCTHPPRYSSIYIYIYKKIDREPNFAGTPVFMRCGRWWNKWQDSLISAIGIFGTPHPSIISDN